MSRFKLQSNYKPIPDQEQAIEKLVQKIKSGEKHLVLHGVTGSGKTFTVANVINRLNMPALIISHNKTLAAQLYQEYRDFFPENAVSYFVSYYDYYQPEAYIPSTDTYIEKDADINEFIDKLRLETTANLITRKDVLVVASVSCIYNIGSPRDYQKFTIGFAVGNNFNREEFIDRLVDLQYTRGDFGFLRGTFRVTGDTISIFPSYMDDGVIIEFDEEVIKKLEIIDLHTGKVVQNPKSFMLFPAKHFIADKEKEKQASENIKKDLHKQIDKLNSEGKKLEAYRLKQKVEYDLEMISEVGYIKGIENYSRYFDGRIIGEAPNTLLTYFQQRFGDNWLVIIDESHITFPQIRGMHAGDLSRKKTLIEYGFRLPSALDNRPLRFDEFLRKIPGFLAASATPSDWEKSLSQGNIVEQLLRPTGIPDPEVEIRPIATQVADCIKEVKKRAEKSERSLITTLTKRTAEDLAEYLSAQGLKVHYLHSDVKTLERTDILDDLRRGNYDALVGINLLREGLDLPEVSLVSILDADKEGFLRSETSLIQTMGRAARHVDGRVILYADKITGSMERALGEVKRRRKYQIAKNKELGITPSTIKKAIREKLVSKEEMEKASRDKREIKYILPEIEAEALTPMDKKKLIKMLKTEMRIAANDLNFELAIEIRDKLRELEN
ncbi:MAG: UvrABC system protein B [Candidatus Woesebacteria bacterium GW2011_GWB1_43_14]|uniref:UvrABC system protein B n=1 Tax=Candidatus Woesebacteria bacterium GW2011_GWB1_43_14 TaxID=1618578 RepID=A0A0G1DHE8_9BACT|nr:MAG: UvrABC system protein B [Candidatus Woesebacteria bacterium GW2011_GWA1_39_11b]KKS78485.1 MAG: UvrABC system protein B [Candidatus Woesebacteria bacterium GW2011_GWC1_42_9]KKS97099.1 MAG: UvrABC system protein B [Candidatus Woesebacteria bacterium GW2011_GWB1_43_14]